jgi:hypothetical protein
MVWCLRQRRIHIQNRNPVFHFIGDEFFYPLHKPHSHTTTIFNVPTTHRHQSNQQPQIPEKVVTILSVSLDRRTQKPPAAGLPLTTPNPSNGVHAGTGGGVSTG